MTPEPRPPATVAATNTFTARDPQALHAALAAHGATVTILDSDRVRCLFPEGLPCESRDPQTGRTATVDVPALIAKHLPAREVVVIKEIRGSALTLGGTAIAFDHTGATVTVDLEQITEHAAQLARTPAHH